MQESLAFCELTAQHGELVRSACILAAVCCCGLCLEDSGPLLVQRCVPFSSKQLLALWLRPCSRP
jgi:hypothetical protein